MAIVYRHRRLDNFQVFYVGVGKNESRASSKDSRSKWWERTVNKSDYEIDILKTNMSWGDACELEIFLISEYGRKDLKKGNLVNMTDGGEGSLGRRTTEEANKERCEPVCKYSLKGEFIKEYPSGLKAAKDVGSSKGNISSACSGKIMSSGGFMWAYKKGDKKTLPTYKKIKRVSLRKSVTQFTLQGVFIKEYSSITEAIKETKIGDVGSACSGKLKTAGGYLWKYKNK